MYPKKWLALMTTLCLLAGLLPGALAEEQDVAVFASDDRVMIFNTAQILPKSTRSTQGVGVMSLKKGRKVVRAVPLRDSAIRNVSRYRVRSLPAAGALLKPEDREEQQLSLMEE